MTTIDYQTLPLTIANEQSQVTFLIDQNKQVRLLYMGEITKNTTWFKKIEPQLSAFPMTQLQITGDNIHHKGVKLNYSGTTDMLIYHRHKLIENSLGSLLIIEEELPSKKLFVSSFFQLYRDNKTIRVWKTIKNNGTETIGIEWLSSLSYTGLLQQDSFPSNFAENIELSVAHNAWTAELQWESTRLKELGLNYYVDGEHKQPSSKRVSITNNSSWSCSEYSPNAILHNTQTGQTAGWQIEHNGAWHYEIGDTGNGDLIYLNLFGPEEYDNHCWIELKPQETFASVPIAFLQLNGKPEQIFAELTCYRRIIRRESKDNRDLPVIFNDYMNCLMGDPTTEIELPLIDAAAKAGCEYFVVDCGWYADGYWWDEVGEWLPSAKRFPRGIEEVIQAIRHNGMIPGLWLEIEVMGIHCPLADQLPDDWFFMRHGKRVIDIDRYHLDFRNPEVTAYADSVLDRLITDYGVGYIKMDYNITTGIGTDYKADSFGEGLLAHNRAYLDWLDRLFQRYPEIVIENCGSGGMRHDYAMLSRHSIQSLTDQTDYLRNGAIAAAGATAITPEQCAVWSYPLEQGDDEEAIYNMVNSMLLRIHQSSYLNRLTSERFDLVSEGIDVYKSIRSHIPEAVPIWPTGIPNIDDDTFSFGLLDDRTLLLGVWNNIRSSHSISIDLNQYGAIQSVEQIYPQSEKFQTSISAVNGKIICIFEEAPIARLFKIEME